MHVASKAREVASFLLDLLTSEKMLKNCTNMLILCNKTDALPDELAGISPKMMVKKRLETEIEALRLARAEALDDIANSTTCAVSRGRPGGQQGCRRAAGQSRGGIGGHFQVV